MTSRELADYVISENEPLDYGWIRYILSKRGFKGLLEIAKNTTEVFAPRTVSKNLIVRAAKLVAKEMKVRTW